MIFPFNEVEESSYEWKYEELRHPVENYERRPEAPYKHKNSMERAEVILQCHVIMKLFFTW